LRPGRPLGVFATGAGDYLPAAKIHAARQLKRESRRILTARNMRRITRAPCIALSSEPSF